jgi:hypothetical protein
MSRPPMLPALPNAALIRFAAAGGLLVTLLAPVPSAADIVPAFDHVIVVIMENKSYDAVRTAPYTAGLIAQFSSFSQSYAVTHPSQPNYIALWSGSTQLVTDNACTPPNSPFTAPNLGQICEASGLSWKAYSEDLPAAGSTVCVAGAGNLYTRKHDPWTQFSNLNHANEVPYTQLAADIAGGTLPHLAFVVPNNCHNTHDCPIATGDTWLSNNLPAMIAAAGPQGLVILTWDEDDFTQANRILTVFAGPRVKSNYVSSRTINHYTVLRTLCDALRMGPYPAAAAADSSITDVWVPPSASVPPGDASGVRLGPARPNPSRGWMSATLELPTERYVEAAIHDSAGRRVRQLFSGPRHGTVEIRWDGRREDGRRAAPGLYFLRVRAGSALLEARLVRIR